MIITASSRRSEKEVYGFAASVTLWVVLVAELYYSHWAGDCAGRWLCSFIVVPLVWFFFMFLLVQVSLWVALIPTKLFRWGRDNYDRVACVLVLSGLSTVSLMLLRETNPLAHLLGWLWWAGLTFCILVNWVGRTQPEDPAEDLEWKPGR
ncbi:MAG: hypothetical protein ACAI34_09220 [Verrucomicrobium sp.]